MSGKFISLIMAASVAVAGIAAAPARADNDDIAKVLAGIAAIAVVGAVIHKSKDRNNDRAVTRHYYNDNSYVPHRKHHRKHKRRHHRKHHAHNRGHTAHHGYRNGHRGQRHGYRHGNGHGNNQGYRNGNGHGNNQARRGRGHGYDNSHYQDQSRRAHRQRLQHRAERIQSLK